MENEKALEVWLKQATSRLSADAIVQVRREIQEHYEAAREDALGRGVALVDASREAVTALGDAAAANRQYRKVMLTSAEAKLLRQTRWESKAFCRWLRWLFLVPVAGLSAGSWFLAWGDSWLGAMLTIGSVGLGLLVASPFLPIYTRSRSRVFRALRWAWMATVLVFAFWPEPVKWLWLMASSAWPMFWMEWRRVAVRRKLPVAQWPRQLFL